MGRWAIDGVEPLEVVSPSSEDQLSRVVASADSDGAALFPRGGGTRIDLGGVPSRPGIVIDMTGIDQVVAHNYADLTATFQAGVTFRQVSDTLSHHGQLLAIDPPLPGRATVGGTLAAGVSGPMKWHFGHPRDTVIGMKVVQPDGQVTKSGGQVVKNVSGYDMSRLHVGGLGSLGIILEASFKLTPVPMYEKTILAAFRGIEETRNAALGIFNSHVMPLAMTAFDASTAHRIGMEAAQGQWRLAVRLGGRSRTLDRQVDDVTTICGQADARELEPVEGRSAERLWESLRDFGWDTENAPPLAIHVSALPSDLPKIVSAADQTKCPALDPSIVAQPGFGAIDIFWHTSSPSPSKGPRQDRHSGEGRNPEGQGARGTPSPLTEPTHNRHSRESRNPEGQGAPRTPSPLTEPAHNRHSGEGRNPEGTGGEGHPLSLEGEGWGEGDRTVSLSEEIRHVISQLQQSITQIGGSAIVQRCPLEVKRDIDVWGGDPPGIETMRRLKKQYDPNNTMNPGRFVGGM